MPYQFPGNQHFTLRTLLRWALPIYAGEFCQQAEASTFELKLLDGYYGNLERIEWLYFFNGTRFIEYRVRPSRFEHQHQITNK